MIRNKIAWCDTTGKLKFSHSVQEGLLPILPEVAGSKHYRRLIRSLCRRAADNKTLLVPGLQESPGDIIAVRDISLSLAGGIMKAEEKDPTPGFEIPAFFNFFTCETKRTRKKRPLRLREKLTH